MSAELLQRNLQVLDRVQRRIAERLRWPVEGGHLVPLEGGRVAYRQQQALLPLDLTPAQVAAALEGEAGPHLYLFGAGQGELPAAWLAQPGRRATVWDRDPWLMRWLLGTRDWTEALGSKRLRLALGVDLLQRPAEARVVLHPVLGAVYRQERRLLDADPAAPLAFLGPGGLFIDDLADALVAEGHRVYGLDLERLSPEECRHAVRAARPRCLVGVNHLEGLAAFCEAERLPALEWEIDPSLSAVKPAEAPTTRTRVFTWRRAHVDEYRARGYQAQHLLLAADPEHRRPPELGEAERAVYGAPLAFVGASMAHRTPGLRQAFLEAYRARRPGSGEAGLRVLEEVLAAQRADFSRYRVPELLQERVPGWTVPPGAVEPERLLGELAAAERRLAFVQALVPLGIRVWGDAGWKQVPGLDYRGPAGHQQELNKIYGGALVQVDLGRLYQLDIVTMRVFDTLACGGFVLAEHCEDLAAAFELGVEVESWRTLEELQDKAAHFLRHPEAARAIAARGRQAVLERHTIRCRVRTMLGTLRAPTSGA